MLIVAMLVVSFINLMVNVDHAECNIYVILSVTMLSVLAPIFLDLYVFAVEMFSIIHKKSCLQQTSHFIIQIGEKRKFK
jgi:hypothetical protein